MCSDNRFLWKVGLQNSAAKYLTSEDFGYELTVLGTSLGRKQTWVLELNHDETVYIRNHLQRYITVDKYGAVKCESEKQSDDGKFIVEYSLDGSGRWSFKNEKYGKYFGGNDKKVLCVALNASEAEMTLWFVQMAIHPQIVLHNKRRKLYFALEENQIRCQDLIPWGPNSIFILEFYAGKYLIKTCDNRYLLKNGQLTNTREQEARFTLELRVNKESKLEGIAFKDNEGKYLAGVGGGAAILKSRNKKITDDELFQVEKSQPQVAFLAANGNFASIKSGFELFASSKQPTKKEIFQLEYDKSSKKWCILTSESKYWSVNKNNGIEATSSQRTPECLFTFEWKCGDVTISASNGNYMGILPNGQLIAKKNAVGENETFRVRLENRPLLVLKSEFGYIGKKKSSANDSEYVCNKSEYEVLSLDHGEKGTYHIKGDHGKYWSMNNTSVFATDKKPEPFVLELVGDSSLVILAPNNQYIVGEHIGRFQATTQVVQKSCIWEF